MKINKTNAFRLWEERFGNSIFATDFNGYLMCKSGYGNPNYYTIRQGRKIYCGWNIHHILPVANGGTNAKDNLICTNIETNRLAEDKTTFCIEEFLYQVRRIKGTNKHKICKIN